MICYGTVKSSNIIISQGLYSVRIVKVPLFATIKYSMLYRQFIENTGTMSTKHKSSAKQCLSKNIPIQIGWHSLTRIFTVLSSIFLC